MTELTSEAHEASQLTLFTPTETPAKVKMVDTNTSEEPITKARKKSPTVKNFKDDAGEYEWRTGRYKTWQAKLIYAQLGDEPSNGDVLIGQMETPKLAAQVVDEHNAWFTE